MRQAETKSPGLPRRMLILIGAFVASFQVVALAPASLLPLFGGFKSAGVRYEAAEGRLWGGTLRGVAIKGVSLGDIAFELAPLSLLTGAPSFTYRVTDGALSGGGRARLSFFGETELTDTRLIFNLGAATRFAFMDAPLEGSLRLETARLVINKEGCAEGEVRMMTDVLQAPARQLGAAGFDLAGAGRCIANDFVAELAGEGAEGSATMVVRITPGLDYAFSATAAPTRKEVAAALEAFGFQRQADGLTTAARGVIKAIGS